MGAATGVAVVLRRPFLVGFFVPVLAGLLALRLTLTSKAIPDAFERYGVGSELVILAALALFVGLLLSGLNYPIIELLQGHFLARLAGRVPVFSAPFKALMDHRRERYKKIKALAAQRADRAARIDALLRLDREYPHDEDDLLPTRLGNVMTSTRDYGISRWGLDPILMSPRIEVLMNADELDRIAGYKADFDLFVNGTVVATFAGLLLLADQVVHQPLPWYGTALYAVPFAVTILLYRASLRPAMRWGDYVRSTLDTHRLELYDRMGIRRPTSDDLERRTGLAVVRKIAYDRDLASHLRRSR